MPGWSGTEDTHAHTQWGQKSHSCEDRSSCLHTRAEEHDGFQVGVLISVRAEFQHAVAELLHPPNVLHDQLDSLCWKFLCRRQTAVWVWGSGFNRPVHHGPLVPSCKLVCRWLIMALRMVPTFMMLEHWAIPRANSSFQHAFIRLMSLSCPLWDERRVYLMLLHSYRNENCVFKVFCEKLTKEFERLGWIAPSA